MVRGGRRLQCNGVGFTGVSSVYLLFVLICFVLGRKFKKFLFCFVFFLFLLYLIFHIVAKYQIFQHFARSVLFVDQVWKICLVIVDENFH